MPQPRNIVGRFMAPGIRTHVIGDTSMTEVIATEDAIVHDPNLGIDRKVFAGQAVPPDLVAPYQEKVGAGDVRDTTETDRQRAAAGTGTSTGTAPDPGASPSEELAGEALQARAQELDIEGRSSMKADELRAAIAAAEANQS